MRNLDRDFYDPETQEGRDDGMVLNPIIFKPFKNVKTGNFFSYAYDVIERNQSPNAEPDIMWVQGAPDKMQQKINAVRKVHDKIRKMKAHLKKIAKKGTALQKEEMQEEINDQFIIIEELIYPESERTYVESKESKRFRLEQQGEMKLDAESIAALRGVGPAAMGSTADASIAQAKLEVAQQQIADMETQDNVELSEALATIKRLEANAKRRDTNAKKKEPEAQ